MAILVNSVVFIAAAAIVWFFAGVLIEAVSRIARRYCKTGFFVSFFILGFLTSVSEISVALNSVFIGVPQAAVGNLAGASFVILLLIVPLLAIAGNGIQINTAVSRRNLLLILAVIILPALLVIDGTVTKSEGLLALLAYGTVAFSLYRNRKSILACDVALERAGGRKPLMADIVRVVMGGLAIFAAAYFLVEQAVFFAAVLSIPVSLVGLILLSIGTNIPEIVIAIRSVMHRKADIALGNYLGSTVMNTFIFGLLAISSGTFFLEANEFIASTALLIVGLLVFFAFAYTRSFISRREGMVLLLFYVAFLMVQFAYVVRFAGG